MSQVSQSTSAVLPSSAAAEFTQALPGALPATYVEADPVQRGQARNAHLLGILGILGTGIYYHLKRKEAGGFALDQMKEAVNFQVLVFIVAVVLAIAGSIAGHVVGLLALVFGLAQLALGVGAIVLSVVNSTKAGKGQPARYPARINVLK